MRGLLNLGGGALVTSGVITSSTMATMSGIALNVAGSAWVSFVHTDSQTVKAAQIIQDKRPVL